MLQPSASRGPTACAFRWKTPRSRASRPRTKRVNAPHNRGVPTVAGIDQPPWGKAAQKTYRRASAAVMSGCEGLAPATARAGPGLHDRADGPGTERGSVATPLRAECTRPRPARQDDGEGFVPTLGKP